MAFILAILGLIFPRILIVILYFFTAWFKGVFDGILIPLLGFLFMPLTVLWYSVVANYFDGAWTAISVIGMVIAVAADLGLLSSARRKRFA
ncbi:MAG: hypothetical protein AAGI49_17095 [Bacteroidota bacterium]